MGQLAPGVHIHVEPNSKKVSIEIVESGAGGHAAPAAAAPAHHVPSTKPPGGDPWAKDNIQKPADAAAAAPAKREKKAYTLEEVRMH